MTAVVISGLISGLLYAMVGLGLVVVYRTSKVLNFAMGGLGSIVAYVALELLALDLPYPVVLLIGVLAGGLLGAVLEFAVARPLKDRPHLTISLATLGLLLIMEGLMGLRYGFEPRSLTPAFDGSMNVSLGPVSISTNQLLIAFLGIASTGLLFYLVMKTRFGIQMRAVSSGPLTSELLGVRVDRVRMSSWVLGGFYGGLAALLVTPLTYLSPGSFTVFLLTAFGAVVLGGFTSIIGVVVGALGFGVVMNLLLSYLDAGLISTYTLIGIALVLIFRPNGLFGRQERQVPEPALPRRVRKQRASTPRRPLMPAWVGTPQAKRLGWAALILLLVVMPFAANERWLFVLATVLATFVGVVGLNVLVGFTGQVSLGHSAFLAIGAYTAAISVREGIHPFVALVLALITSGVVGALLGLPSTRLKGIYLTLLTLIFAFALPELILYFKPLTNGASGLPLTPPSFLLSTPAMYWFMLVIAVVVVAVVLFLSRSSVGRAWRAVRDSEAGAKSLGLNPALVKLGAFTLGSALAGLGGALGGLTIGYVSPDSYGVFVSIYALLAVVLGGQGSIIGSFLGALFITIIPEVSGGVGIPQDLLFGVALLLILYLAPKGLVGLFSGRRRAAPAEAAVAAAEAIEDPIHLAAPGEGSASAAEAVEVPVDDAILQLRNVSAGYGADTIIRGIDMHVREGEIVALLGANGAGKSTMLRAISGLIGIDGGHIVRCGETISPESGKGPAAAARTGLSHVPEGRGIFPDLTVRENLVAGTFAGKARTLDSAELDGVFKHFPILKDRLTQLAGNLSGGEQQMLAIARALVARPKLLMLDEPSLGLSPLYSQQVFDILEDIAATGVSILLVEQNAHASLKLADRAYVLARGKIVLSGAASDLAADSLLRDSYLEVPSA